MSDESKETIVKHYYNLPEVAKTEVENLRQVAIVTLNQSVTLTSSFECDFVSFLIGKALDILNKVKEEDKK